MIYLYAIAEPDAVAPDQPGLEDEPVRLLRTSELAGLYSEHERKVWAEIDFVLVTDSGVLCLEVKGGTLIHRGGDWLQNDRRLKQSPFAQAGGGAA